MLQPTGEEAAICTDSYNQAVALNDAETLTLLIQIGDLMFADYATTQALVAQGRNLADKYLALSAELLQANQVRTAQRLMRRANELMSSLNG